MENTLPSLPEQSSNKSSRTIGIVILLVICVVGYFVFKSKTPASTPEQIMANKINLIDNRPIDKIYLGDVNADGNTDALFSVVGEGESANYLYAFVDKFNSDGSANIFRDVAPFLYPSKIVSLSMTDGIITITIAPGGLAVNPFEFNSEAVTKNYRATDPKAPDTKYLLELHEVQP